MDHKSGEVITPPPLLSAGKATWNIESSFVSPISRRVLRSCSWSSRWVQRLFGSILLFHEERELGEQRAKEQLLVYSK